ncbi:MAG: F0F1 ATP synthase subunit A [Clostridia bacterium]|nr:F0F1 ATP synthase subunit A [Clostridia bacterium]
MEFGIKRVFTIPFKLFGEDIVITETIFNTWIIMAILIMFAVIVRLSVKNFEKHPKGFQNFIEALVSGLNNLTSNTMGEKNKAFAGYFGTVFLFILLSNLSGLFTLRPPTADIATTLGLALITFILVQFFTMRTRGIIGYIKKFFEPIPMLFPLNVIGEVANPISLGFRLFGNILGGLIIMNLYYSLLPLMVKFGVPAALHFYFDVFAGVLQTLIFVMLSMTFVAGATEE